MIFLLQITAYASNCAFLNNINLLYNSLKIQMSSRFNVSLVKNQKNHMYKLDWLYCNNTPLLIWF